MIKRLTLVLLGTTIYAVARYAVFGQVSPMHIPVYLLNKSVSMASALFMLAAAWNATIRRTDCSRSWGTASFHCAFVHILMSLCILTGDYYPKLFDADQLNLSGEIAILCGVLTAYCFWCIRWRGAGVAGTRSLPLLSSLFLSGHLAAIGWTNWASVDKWPGFMPPISLISFLCAAASLILFARNRNGVADLRA